MTTSKFEFDKLVTLLSHSENDLGVTDFFGPEMANIKRDEYYGTLEFKSEGVGVVFQEAPWVVPQERIKDPKELYLAAFHLHTDRHEGFQGYACPMPNGIGFGDSEQEVLRKMGKPLRIGGGGTSRVTGGAVPRWFWYPLGEAILHVQFDPEGRVEMVTPRVPDVKTEF